VPAGAASAPLVPSSNTSSAAATSLGDSILADDMTRFLLRIVACGLDDLEIASSARFRQ
jgi:hypothetical protein